MDIRKYPAGIRHRLKERNPRDLAALVRTAKSVTVGETKFLAQVVQLGLSREEERKYARLLSRVNDITAQLIFDNAPLYIDELGFDRFHATASTTARRSKASLAEVFFDNILELGVEGYEDRLNAVPPNRVVFDLPDYAVAWVQRFGVDGYRTLALTAHALGNFTREGARSVDKVVNALEISDEEIIALHKNLQQGIGTYEYRKLPEVVAALGVEQFNLTWQTLGRDTLGASVEMLQTIPLEDLAAIRRIGTLRSNDVVPWYKHGGVPAVRQLKKLEDSSLHPHHLDFLLEYDYDETRPLLSELERTDEPYEYTRFIKRSGMRPRISIEFVRTYPKRSLWETNTINPVQDLEEEDAIDALRLLRGSSSGFLEAIARSVPALYESRGMLGFGRIVRKLAASPVGMNVAEHAASIERSPHISLELVLESCRRDRDHRQFIASAAHYASELFEAGGEYLVNLGFSAYPKISPTYPSEFFAGLVAAAEAGVENAFLATYKEAHAQSVQLARKLVDCTVEDAAEVPFEDVRTILRTRFGVRSWRLAGAFLSSNVSLGMILDEEENVFYESNPWIHDNEVYTVSEVLGTSYKGGAFF